MRFSVIINLGLDDVDTAKAVSNALRPDDTDVPEGFSLKNYVINNSLIYVVNAVIDDSKKILTLNNVVDDILRHIILALSSIKSSR
jgi:hypothetical protein